MLRYAALAAVLLATPAFAAEHYYDLGGPCKEAQPTRIKEIVDAQRTSNWNRLVDLQKLEVRDSCGNEFRWFELAKALLLAHRPAEAVQVLEEMDARDLDLNPSLVVRFHPEVKALMDDPAFKSTPAGIKLEALKRSSNERRAKFRAMLTTLPASQRPPDHYIAKGACPFECCTYRKWTVREDTDLVAAPGSQRVVGKAKKGSAALGLTGEVHLTPIPVVVVGDVGLPKDTISFILDYSGEGYGHVYSQGKVLELFHGYSEYCFRTSEYCWGETLLPSAPTQDTQKSVWWVKVKLPNGVIGWTDKSGNFDGQDACG